ncbi:MAG: hypothetical protein H0X34_14095 [Chthoniobacterales bacterium]|nr:hypothetical protein [Chthoniobacterales bacterium]
MKNKSASRSAFINLRALLGFVLASVDVVLALLGLSIYPSSLALAQGATSSLGNPIVVHSYYNDVSPALRDQPAWPEQALQQHEAAENPLIVLPHTDAPDPKVDRGTLLSQLVPSIPAPILNFAGIPYPGVICSCAPPDTNGEVGATQYVQIVNEGYQVFDKTNGASVLGPVSINSVWAGFPGSCATGAGDPVVLYDQIANRWILSQFAVGTGSGIPTDECIAVSTTSDATGSYNRYGFHLGSDFFDYPHLGVWPDAYYMSMNIFNSEGTAYLGPQAFSFDRAKMLAGQPATFISFPALDSTQAPFLPADLDGSTLPPNGAPNPFVQFPSSGKYNVYHFHSDFVTPANSRFTLFSSPAAAGFTQLCVGNRNCIPQRGQTVTNKLDAIADRLMFRLPYRNFGDHEALVGNFTVSVSGTAGIRFFELRGVTAGPVSVFQEGTYSPDSTNRWMASVAMDGAGNIAAGFSASDATIFPQLRYAGRLKNDPLGTFAQGEAHLFGGTGAQINTNNRWGDYSDLTVDPVDDSTFWYTSEYYDSTSSFNWRTRIGSFKMAKGGGGVTLVSAASRLSHGAAGTFSVNMPLSDPSGVEDRGASTYSAVLTFSAPVASGQVIKVSGTAIVGAPTFSGNTMTVPLTGVANEQIVTLRAQNINGSGQPTGDVAFGFLIADANANRVVGKTDNTQIRGQVGQPVTAANFRDDVDANGAIAKADALLVRTHTGEAIP